MKIHTMESRKADEKPASEGKSEERSWNSFDWLFDQLTNWLIDWLPDLVLD